MANIDSVKPWFETGDFPTQAQFYQWMDWLRWKDETIAFSDLSPALQDIINGMATTEMIRPEYLELNAGTTNQFLMNAEYKLVSIAINNHSLIDMVLVFTKDSNNDEVLTVEIAAGATSDNFVNQTFWTEELINIAGITGDVALLIDRK